MECRCHWHDTSETGVRWCTSWWPLFRLHRNLRLFGFDGFISMQLGHQSDIWENHRESKIWTVIEECRLRLHYQIEHPSWRKIRPWVGGILTGKALLLLCRPLYRDDVGNCWMLVLLKRNFSGRICRIHLYLLDIWEHKLWPCNVEDVYHCCMGQEILVQVQYQGECGLQAN